MHKITTITATLIALLAVGSAFGQGQNLLASGEITLGVSTNEKSYTQSVGLYDSVRKTDWGRVLAVVVKNNSDFATTTTVARVDLDDTTTLITAAAASNATTYASYTAYGSTANSVVVYSATNDEAIATNTVTTYYPVPPPCARELLITVTIPTNDAESTLEYLIYGD